MTLNITEKPSDFAELEHHYDRLRLDYADISLVLRENERAESTLNRAIASVKDKLINHPYNQARAHAASIPQSNESGTAKLPPSNSESNSTESST